VERKSRGEQPSIEVTVEHVPAPDAKERLAKAYRIILAAAQKLTESDGGPENDATRSASSTPESESADDRDCDHDAN